MSSLRRVNYFTGRLLSAEDFGAEQEYHREKSRLHNRRLHGSGVVSGLTVSLTGGASRAAIKVKPGVGIDPAGNELELDAERSLSVGVKARAFLVVLRYVERPVEPVPSFGTGCDSDATGFARIEEDCEPVLVPDGPPRRREDAGLSLARYVRAGSTWQRDRAFKAARVRVVLS
jgi:hypothetical protein